MLKKNKGLIILSQYFYPDLASTSQLLTELAEDLNEYGYHIKVYTVKPSYLKNKIETKKEEIYKGIDIYRVAATRFNKNNIFCRLFNFFSYVFLVFSKLLFRKDKYPLLIVSNPPFLSIIGLLFRKIKKQKYIYLIHDIYPEIAVKMGYLKEKNIIVKLWDKINYQVLVNAEKVIVLGEYMAENIKKKYQLFNDHKIKIIHNWADESFIIPIKKEKNWFIKKYNLEDKFIILYLGNIGLLQDLSTVINAAEKLKAYKDILFLFIGEGGGLNKLRTIVNQKKLYNVKFLPYQTKENLPYSFAASDISIIALKKGIEGLAVPCKTYGILASGRPIIGLVSKDCEVAEIISDAQCGYRVEQGNVNGLLEKIKYIYEDPEILEIMGENSRKFFEKHFTRKKITKAYYETIEEIYQKNIES